ncbi:carbamoyltransferase N-terminal domain-containing protein [Micromonospora sp. NPDC049060]|uniref:carbamoyltransferase N-terminal domain-containing protein n=1 Tax=Micromonospora sp. NPDC049060 TaxID=3154828 RepID=UPI0033F8F1CA
MGYLLGLGGPYEHDSSACLLHEETGIVAFVEEERLNRRKRNAGSRAASRSAAFCLDQAGIGPADVDAVVVGWNPRWPEQAEPITDGRLIRKLLAPEYFGGYSPDRIEVVHHHVAHAASAFYCRMSVTAICGPRISVASPICVDFRDGGSSQAPRWRHPGCRPPSLCCPAPLRLPAAIRGRAEASGFRVRGRTTGIGGHPRVSRAPTMRSEPALPSRPRRTAPSVT